MVLQQEEGPKVICKKCKRLVMVNEMRREGESWLCFSCYENVHFFEQARKKIAMQKQGLTQEIKSDNILEKVKSKTEARNYQCFDCSYKFTSSAFNEESLCPYCGEKGSVRWVQ